MNGVVLFFALASVCLSCEAGGNAARDGKGVMGAQIMAALFALIAAAAWGHF